MQLRDRQMLNNRQFFEASYAKFKFLENNLNFYSSRTLILLHLIISFSKIINIWSIRRNLPLKRSFKWSFWIHFKKRILNPKNFVFERVVFVSIMIILQYCLKAMAFLHKLIIFYCLFAEYFCFSSRKQHCNC